MEEPFYIKAKLVAKYMTNYMQPLMKDKYKRFWNQEFAWILGSVVEAEMFGKITHRQGRDFITVLVKELKSREDARNTSPAMI
jgi:hypothetical protein